MTMSIAKWSVDYDIVTRATVRYFFWRITDLVPGHDEGDHASFIRCSRQTHSESERICDATVGFETKRAVGICH